MGIPTIHNRWLDEFFPTREDGVGGLRVCHDDLISTGSYNGEQRAKLIMQSMLVMEGPAHIGTPSPCSQAER